MLCSDPANRWEPPKFWERLLKVASWAQPGPILWTQCDMLKAYIFTAISIVFRLWWGFAGGYVAHIGLVLGLRCKMPPHRTKLRRLSPTCVQTCPQAAPCWTPVGLKLRPVGLKLRPSWSQLVRVHKWAPVRPNLRGQGLKDGQVWPQSALVGPSTPAPFLSVQFSGCGWFSSLVAKRLE